ncbi:MAG TPA: HAD family hydrolase, partial [Opitutales bacterium]|nr:HAD family hydrolase [Opitutales bacterium]
MLATDLDGTLIPLAGNLQNREDLEQLATSFKGSGRTLVFATGRSFESVLEAIRGIPLPDPDWIV